MPAKTISFYTIGCRLNQAETAAIKHTFEAQGYSLVEQHQPADIAVINTCTVTESGDTDTRRLVNKISRMNPDAEIALVGCQAQIQKKKLAGLPNVRWIVGNARKMELVTLFARTKGLKTPQVITPTIPRDSFTMPIAGIDRSHTRANLKVQDGCDFFCSFCEIPYARGRARSREFDDIIKEARALAQGGHKEVVLTGINVGTYKNSGKTLFDVISALEGIKKLERIRISSIEPTTFSLQLIKKMKKGGKLCRFLHIPLQSGSDEILKLMRRRYSSKEFKEFVAEAMSIVPELCMGTDLIVGFPGETDFFFAQTYDLVKNFPFAYFHVFSYSARYMAKSRNLTGRVDPKVVKKRSQLLRDLSFRHRQVFLTNLIDTAQDVLFEQKKNNLWTGLTDNYVRVKVQSDQRLNNQIRSVRLASIDGQTAIGKLTG